MGVYNKADSRIYQTKYSDCVHARARADNAVRQLDSESIKQAINNLLTLSQSTMMDYYQNEVPVGTLLKHKSETLEMYRKLICLNLAAREEAILLGYVQHNIVALDDAINTHITKPGSYKF